MFYTKLQSHVTTVAQTGQTNAGSIDGLFRFSVFLIFLGYCGLTYTLGEGKRSWWVFLLLSSTKYAARCNCIRNTTLAKFQYHTLNLNTAGNNYLLVKT